MIVQLFNLFITMVIGGLWHGPSWNFVIWGALHGLGLAVVRLWQTKFGHGESNGCVAGGEHFRHLSLRHFRLDLLPRAYLRTGFGGAGADRIA